MAKSFLAKQNIEQRKAFNFSTLIENAAYRRQQSRCALCGKSREQNDFTGHHVIPVRHGCLQPNTLYYSILSSSQNCVMVCRRGDSGSSCHLKVHGNNWANGPVASPREFKYSHGNDFVAHSIWAQSLNEKKEKGACLFYTMPRGKSK